MHTFSRHGDPTYRKTINYNHMQQVVLLPKIRLGLRSVAKILVPLRGSYNIIPCDEICSKAVCHCHLAPVTKSSDRPAAATHGLRAGLFEIRFEIAYFSEEHSRATYYTPTVKWIPIECEVNQSVEYRIPHK